MKHDKKMNDLETLLTQKIYLISGINLIRFSKIFMQPDWNIS
jgi:hypothetical protein